MHGHTWLAITVHFLCSSLFIVYNLRHLVMLVVLDFGSHHDAITVAPPQKTHWLWPVAAPTLPPRLTSSKSSWALASNPAHLLSQIEPSDRSIRRRRRFNLSKMQRIDAARTSGRVVATLHRVQTNQQLLAFYCVRVVRRGSFG